MGPAALTGTSPGFYCLAGYAKQAGVLSLLAVLLFTHACRNQVNTPDRVAEQFLEAITNGSRDILASIIAWDEVVVNDYYVTQDFYSAQTPEKKQQIIREYKQKFYTDYLPGAGKVKYRVKKIFIARSISDAYIEFSFPGQSQPEEKKNSKLEFMINMKLDSKENRWYIVDLGDFLRLNFLRGDFDPQRFYLPIPISP